MRNLIRGGLIGLSSGFIVLLIYHICNAKLVDGMLIIAKGDLFYYLISFCFIVAIVIIEKLINETFD